MSESGIVLDGLDGGTPLGFLAGVGVQRVLADRMTDRHDEKTSPRLSWRLLDAWRPVLHGPPLRDAIVHAIHDDARAWEAAPILRFRYLKVEKKGGKPFGGLRAPVAVLRRWLADRQQACDEASLAYALALMCETATEPIKDPPPAAVLAEHHIEVDPEADLDRVTLPTFFDFTSRNVQFLDQIGIIRGYLNADVISAGLSDELPDGDAPSRRMEWDLEADTPAAIYTGHPKAFRPVAEWLAFRGLVCFPVTGVGASLQTTACTGRRKDGHFTWPLWEVPAGPETVRSLVAHPGLARLDVPARRALGIAVVLRAGLSKMADGKTGTFLPPQPV